MTRNEGGDSYLGRTPESPSRKIILKREKTRRMI
jgi:hypothetical protein